MKRFIFSLLLVTLAASSLSATSYIAMTDTDLADTSAIIAEVQVLGKLPAPTAGMPATDYHVVIERVIKGVIAESTAVIRVPGGVGADGRGVVVYGAPSFEAGEQALLFLGHGPSGTYRIEQLMLGAFHRVEQNGRALAVRNLSEATRLGGPSQEPLRDFTKFSHWLTRHSRGQAGSPDYAATAGETSGLRSYGQRFSIIRAEGRWIRWFEFDDGGSVPWRMSNGSFGRPQFEEALAAWSNHSSRAPIRLEFVGRTNASGGFTTFDGVNTFQSEDPNNELGVRFNCSRGGVLAAAAPWFDVEETGEWKGRTYVRIQGADIITARGTRCFFSGRPDRQAEVWGHEVGHTLGFAHSCGDTLSPSCDGKPRLDNALMRAFAHDDGRGATISDDDSRGIERLYGNGSGGENFDPRTGGLSAPGSLREVVGGAPSNVELKWTDTNGLEDNYIVFLSSNGSISRKVQTLPRDTEGTVVSGLGSGTHRLKVRAKNASGRSEFSNVVEVTVP